MLNQLFIISYTALYLQQKSISQIENKLLDSSESNLIQHLPFGDPSKDRELNTKVLNATVNSVLITKRSDERLF